MVPKTKAPAFVYLHQSLVDIWRQYHRYDQRAIRLDRDFSFKHNEFLIILLNVIINSIIEENLTIVIDFNVKLLNIVNALVIFLF